MVLLILLILAFASSSQQAFVTWTNFAGGKWDDPSNWDSNTVPAVDDSVVIKFDPVGTPFTVDISNVTVYSLQAVSNGNQGGPTLPTLKGSGSLSVSNFYCDNFIIHLLDVEAWNLFNSASPCWLVQCTLSTQNETVLMNTLSLDNSSSVSNQGSFSCQSCIVDSEDATGSSFINYNLLSIYYNSLFAINLTNYGTLNLIHKNFGDLTIGTLHNVGNVTSSGCFYLHTHNNITQYSGSMSLGGLWINSLLPNFEILLNGGSLYLDNDALGCPTKVDGTLIANNGTVTLQSTDNSNLPFYLQGWSQSATASVEIRTSWDPLLKEFLIPVTGQCVLHGKADIQIDGTSGSIPSYGGGGMVISCGSNTGSWFDAVTVPTIPNLGVFRVDTLPTQFYITPQYELELKMMAYNLVQEKCTLNYNFTCFYHHTDIHAKGVQVGFDVEVTQGKIYELMLFASAAATDSEGIQVWIMYSHLLEDDLDFILTGYIYPCNNNDTQLCKTSVNGHVDAPWKPSQRPAESLEFKLILAGVGGAVLIGAVSIGTVWYCRSGPIKKRNEYMRITLVQ